MTDPKPQPLTPTTITTRLQACHHTLQTQYHLRRIALFGSIAQGTQTPNSDIDLVVEFEQPIGLKFVELCEYLETCLETPVDVLTLTGVQQIRQPAVVSEILEQLVHVWP
ncbi:MAG: nucleotidyltransferase family protein [Prochlorothrix sp.]